MARKRKRKDSFSVRTTLLQALIDGPSYGYEMVKKIKDRTDGKIVVGQGSLYPALADLERDGLVTAYESEPLEEKGNRPRKYYELTAEGLRQAQGEREIAMRLFQFGPEGARS